jgi:hypothetical protein
VAAQKQLRARDGPFACYLEDRVEYVLPMGARNSHIATLVERHSRFTALVKVPSKDTAAVVAAPDPLGDERRPRRRRQNETHRKNELSTVVPGD